MYRRVVQVRATLARWLEQGPGASPLLSSGARALAAVHAPFASRGVARPLDIPAREPRLFVVAVGGATLGGSGKTRVALACVRELAASGANVVLIGHAYGARRGLLGARVVSPDDSLDEVGDEALACARELAAITAARVVVGGTRQAAIDYAARLRPHVDVVVIDGPLQLAPQRASLSLLAVDAREPWGAGDVAPAGDLRAPREALLAHTDHVVTVDATPRNVHLDGATLSLDVFANTSKGSRIGLFTAIARPGRLTKALVAAGVSPHVFVRAADHGPMTARLCRELDAAPVDLWLATAKCAVHLESLARGGVAAASIPPLRLAILDGSLVLPLAIRRTIAHFAPRT